MVPDSLSVGCLAWGFSECLMDMEGLRSFRLIFVPFPIFSSLLGALGSLLFPFFPFSRLFFGGSGVLSQGADSS